MQRSRLVQSVLVIFVLGLSSLLFASVTFTPPSSAKPMNMAMIALKPQQAAPKASGMVSLVSDQSKTKCTFAVEAKGLDPKQVYTAWFVGLKTSGGRYDTSKMQGIGSAPYTLKVDSTGTAKLTINGSCTDVLKWQKLEIIQHPDKNPKNMKNMRLALVGDLTQLK